MQQVLRFLTSVTPTIVSLSTEFETDLTVLEVLHYSSSPALFSTSLRLESSHEIPEKSHEIQYESLEIPLESFEFPEKSPEIQYESLEIQYEYLEIPDVSSIIDHYLEKNDEKVTFKMPHKMKRFKDIEDLNTDSILPFFIASKGHEEKEKVTAIAGEYEGHFIGECLNPKENKAFVGAAWSDSEEGVEPQKDAKCLMAINSQENTSHMMNALKETRMESRQMILSVHHGLEMLLDIISKMNKKLEDENIKVNDRGERKVNDF
ncbi:hypothetical protein Tco_0553610 [Tanacetum coccineum]